MKWFDLKDVDAKLDRVRVAAGQHVLRISMDANAPVLEDMQSSDLERFGWIGQSVEDGVITFDNHRAILKAADVAQSLQAFYAEADIRSFYRPISDLSQGETVSGLKTRDMATMEDFQNDMTGVSAKDMSRIQEAILRAQDMAQKTANSVASQPLEGRGFELVSKLANAESVELAVASVVLATGQHSRPALNDALLEFADEDIGSDPSARAIDTIKSVVPERLVSMVEKHISISSEIDAIMTEGKATRLQLALDFMRGKVPVRALEPAMDQPGEVSELETAIGLKVRRDKSLPTNQYRHTLTGTARAMLAMAEGLNKDASSLIPSQDTVLLRVSRKSSSANENVVGRQTTVAVHDSIDGEEAAGVATAISVSATKGGSFVHEFGHLVAETYNVTQEEMKDLLENSGVRGRVFRAVRIAVDREWISSDMANYLRSDDEIFARTYEAAFVNRAIVDGDQRLQSIGGFSAAFPGDQYSPFGDSQLTEKFLTDLNELLEKKQALSHGKKRSLASSVEP